MSTLRAISIRGPEIVICLVGLFMLTVGFGCLYVQGCGGRNMTPVLAKVQKAKSGP